jgi:hypothetical protein
MLAALSTIAPLAKMLFSTVDKAIPDKDLAEKLKAQLNTQLLQSSTEEIKAAASIVEAEAKSHWFVSSWRPLLMYVLIFILVWNYVIGPVIKIFTGTIITFELPGDVWTLLNIGLGGYVVGRSGEIKKIKNKICKIICKIFKITPCVCDHECNCKKENK